MRRSTKRLNAITPEFVEFIPEKLEPGMLYISRRYATASHLCCCGCGSEVVTPLNPAKWRLSERGGGRVSLDPSIGNWSFPCKSHYFIEGNGVTWAGSMSRKQIAAVRARDREDAWRLTGNPDVADPALGVGCMGQGQATVRRMNFRLTAGLAFVPQIEALLYELCDGNDEHLL